MNRSEIRFSGSLHEYLQLHFCDAATLAAASNISTETLRSLITSNLVPNAAYVVDEGHLSSYAFGRMPAAEAPSGAWFSPANTPWVQRALQAISVYGQDAAAGQLRTRFQDDYCRAFRASHATEGPIPGYVRDDNHAFDSHAFDADFDSVWSHFLAGTYSLCVQAANDEARIAEKEILQLRLSAATEGGEKLLYNAAESHAVHVLIDRYVEASMPFSPIEYARSSRRRLVEAVLPRLVPR